MSVTASSYTSAAYAVERIFSDPEFKTYSETCKVVAVGSQELEIAAQIIANINDRYSKWQRKKK